MLHQERCHHHTHPVVHPACAPQLPHTGIHQRVPSLTCQPDPLPGSRLSGRLRCR
jgi:hypothetical protein